MPITGYLEDDVFDDAATRAMGVAFQRACEALRLTDKSDPLTMLVACEIIDAARKGERDPDKLYDAVLKWIGSATRRSGSGQRNPDPRN